MRLSLLNFISTPVPVLNTLGLDLRVGLSSEDPMVERHPSEPYEGYLSTYSAEGLLLARRHLGQIPPDRRLFFDISGATRDLVSGLDHLSVIHRVPSRMLAQAFSIEEEVEIQKEPDYSFFRSLVEYSYPQGGNGSVIYETPPRLNSVTSQGRSSNTLTFTCQTVVSEIVNTYVVLVHYSVNPDYSQVANYHFALHSLSGERVLTEHVTVGPFAVRVLDMGQIIPEHIIERERDPQDGQSSFTFVGYSEDAALMVVVLNTAPSLGAVAVEHTHPTQTYLLPWDSNYQRAAKADAQRNWKSIMSGGITPPP